MYKSCLQFYKQTQNYWNISYDYRWLPIACFWKMLKTCFQFIFLIILFLYVLLQSMILGWWKWQKWIALSGFTSKNKDKKLLKICLEFILDIIIFIFLYYKKYCCLFILLKTTLKLVILITLVIKVKLLNNKSIMICL